MRHQHEKQERTTVSIVDIAFNGDTARNLADDAIIWWINECILSKQKS